MKDEKLQSSQVSIQLNDKNITRNLLSVSSFSINFDLHEANIRKISVWMWMRLFTKRGMWRRQTQNERCEASALQRHKSVI